MRYGIMSSDIIPRRMASTGGAMSEGHGIIPTGIIPEIHRRGHVRRTWYNVVRHYTAPHGRIEDENLWL